MKQQIKYPQRESRTLEFKETIADYRRLAKTTAAFANGIGGTIFIGIQDKTRLVTGISEDQIDKYFEEIPRAVFQLVTPNLIVYPFERNFEGCSLFGLNVYPGDNKPYYLTSEGRNRGVYIRIGAHTMRANEQFIGELKLQRENRSYDEGLLCNQSVDGLDRKLIEECFAQKVSDNFLESNQIIGRDHISGERYPTIGGVVMFHPKPSQIIPEAYITCARMKGASGREIIETYEFEGPVPRAAESAVKQVKDWLEREFSLDGSKLRGHFLVPPPALREGVYNAVFHRKYNIAGAIKITLWADRLEIFSPGHFVGLMDLQNLGDGTTYIRNRVISALARKIRLMEKRGTGIRLIIDSCKKQGGVIPTFEEGADWVKLTFKFLTTSEQAAMTTEEHFQKLLKTKDVITNREVVQSCRVSRETANSMIKREIDLGRLRQDGKGCSTKYWTLKSP